MVGTVPVKLEKSFAIHSKISIGCASRSFESFNHRVSIWMWVPRTMHMQVHLSCEHDEIKPVETSLFQSLKAPAPLKELFVFRFRP